MFGDKGLIENPHHYTAASSVGKVDKRTLSTNPYFEFTTSDTVGVKVTV